MKILAVCYEDPQNILGGMGMHVRELYRAMARRGEVTIDLLTDSEKDGSEEFDGYTKHYSDKLVSWKPRHAGMACLMQMDVQMARKLSRLFAEGHRWDVVHCHEWQSLQISKMARDAMRVPMVGTIHLCLTKLIEVEDPFCDYSKMGEADLYMMGQEGSLVCESDKLVVASRAYERVMRETFMTDRQIHVIPNGIDTAIWHPQAGEAKRATQKHELGDRPIALYVGRIATMKGIVPLLDAIERGENRYTVVVAGEVNANSEEERERWHITGRLRALESEYPERLRWVGFQHGQDLRDLYAAAHVVVMPSIHEPFGIVALEAMAMGCPLISTEMDGLREIVMDGQGNEYSMIIPSRSAKSINDALGVLENASVRRELIELGLRRAQEFSWDQIAARTIGVYQEVLSHAGESQQPSPTASTTQRQDSAHQH